MNALVNQDEEHLRLLSIFHYVVGGLLAIVASVPLIHVALGLFIILAPAKMGGHGPPPPAIIGWFFVVFGSFICVTGWLLAALTAIAGRQIARRKHLLFCQVVAGLVCLFMPVGTVLGVFKLMVLLSPTVKPRFDAPGAAT